MHEWTLAKRTAYGALQAAGLGFLGASLELVALAATSKLPLTMPSFLQLTVVHLLVMGALASAVALPIGLLVHSTGQRRPADAISIQLGFTTTVLLAWFLGSGALVLVNDNRLPEAMFMGMMPIAFGAVFYFNARYWLRRTELGVGSAIGWIPVSAAMALAVGATAGAVHGARDTGGTVALEGDPNLLIIAVDGLRADAIGAYGGPSSEHIDALASRGARFVNAVSPAPQSTAAVAVLFTGLHPLRARITQDNQTLSKGYTTLAEVLQKEGYAVGGFVSTSALGTHTALDQGFQVWDDNLAPVPGLNSLNIPQQLLRLTGLAATERPAAHTLSSLSTWLDTHGSYPFFAFVHLPEPTSSSGYPEAVQTLDQTVGAILNELETRGLAESTMVVLTGTHGTMRGEHGIGSGNRGLYEPVVRIPLIIHKPGVELQRPVITKQVRLMDIMPTALEWHGLDPRDESEGVDLAGMDSDILPSLPTTLIGHGLKGEALIGVRNNGVKYIRPLTGKDAMLFALQSDPQETKDISRTQTKTLTQAEGMVVSDAAAFKALLEAN